MNTKEQIKRYKAGELNSREGLELLDALLAQPSAPCVKQKIQDVIIELEAEYTKENDEMHRVYSEWPESSLAAQQRMFRAGEKLALLRGLLA